MVAGVRIGPLCFILVVPISSGDSVVPTKVEIKGSQERVLVFTSLRKYRQLHRICGCAQKHGVKCFISKVFWGDATYHQVDMTERLVLLFHCLATGKGVNWCQLFWGSLL